MNKSSVQNLVRNYSIETTVPQAERVERFSDIVPSGTCLYIAHIPGTNFQDTVKLAARLRSEGMEPVPHVVGRRIESLAALEDFLKSLAGDAGVRQVLVVAGDNATPAGELTSGLQILESGLLEKYGMRTVGVAGHPEGHREVTESVLRDALRRKNAYADKTGSKVYVVTQFTFNAESIITWEMSHIEDIGRLPVTAGLPGLASAKTLLKYAMDCGVGASLTAFSKRAGSLTKLLTVSAPDDILVGLAAHCEQHPESRLTGIHFFPFGGFKKTADWANKVVAGNFEFTDDGGLRVD
ncbi:MAG TPA: methylenetetrahydrofolate reductase [Rhodothermia bacterium]|nr:methylenetetrahydrofolate reductase [Rhodothermia bacterium]